MTMKRTAGPEGATFSSSVSVSGEGAWVYVSGHIAAGATLAEQTRSCFTQIADVLALHGGSLTDVVRITAYLTGLEEYAEYARVRGECFGDDLPASTAFQVAGLLYGALVEIDAVAFIPS